MTAPQHDPAITVVIPTYNRGAEVCAAIQSVLSQTGTSFAVVVVDDGSTDDTLERLLSVQDDRVTVLPSPHEGVSAARNRGAASATTPWLTFLDSDDLAVPGWLAALVGALSGGADLVTCGATLCYPDGTTRTPSPVPLGPAFGSITGHFLAGSFAVATELFRAVGGYLPGLAYSENTELGMRLGTEVERRGARWVALPDALVQVAATERAYDAERYYASGRAVLAASGERLALDPHLLALYLGITGTAAARCGHTADARRLLWKAWRLEPFTVRHPLRLCRSQLPLRRWR